MISHDVEQGTPEWQTLRLGIPTASQFHRILTPKTMKLSSQRFRYMAELLAERATGQPTDADGSAFMTRGSQMEAEARQWYEFENDLDVERVGFITANDCGGSPDGLVGDDGIIEIKCRSAPVHMEVLMGHAEPASKCQTQGLLLVSGRAWCDVVNFCPGLDPHVTRQRVDDDFAAALSAALAEFNRELEEKVSALF